MSFSHNILNNKRYNVTIDGLSKSGKSSCGRLVAKELDLQLLDSGIFYRIFSWFQLKRKNKDIKKSLKEFDPSFRDGSFFLNEKKINEKDLYEFEVESFVQEVAKIKEVRKKITKICQGIIKEKGFLIIGRDAGTVIDPNAEIKFFFKISKLTQKKRIKKIFEEKNDDQIEEEIKKRNTFDLTRKEGPLIKSPDSIIFQNEGMLLEEAAKSLIETIQKKVEEMAPRVVIIGTVNAGKSSVFNLLTKEKKAIVSKEENTTRDFLEKKMMWKKKSFILVDAAGFNFKKEKEDYEKKMFQKTEGAIRRAEVLVWVEDIKKGFDKDIEKTLNLINKKKAKTILLLNKNERATNKEEKKNELKKSGLKKIIFFSVKRRIGLRELKNEICKMLPKQETKEHEEAEDESFKVFVLGKANAGKSSLLNALTNESVSIVSPKPHTTTNIVEKDFYFEKKTFRFFDTAGIRRSRLKKSEIEKKSEKKIKENIKNANLVIFLCDVSKMPTVQDKRIVDLIKKNDLPFFLVGNKEDLLLERNKEKKIFKDFWKYTKNLHIFFISAKWGSGIQKLKKNILIWTKGC